MLSLKVFGFFLNLLADGGGRSARRFDLSFFFFDSMCGSLSLSVSWGIFFVSFGFAAAYYILL